jgi:putative redox protein
MAVETEVVYTGNNHCDATHGPSQHTISTDLPVDNGGKGQAFSPTDLVAAALGTCILTIMGKVAERHGWDLAGTRIHVTKEMAAAPLRRIGALKTVITLPKGRTWSPDDRRRLENAADTCPVKKSLHADVQVPIEFVYPE